MSTCGDRTLILPAADPFGVGRIAAIAVAAPSAALVAVTCDLATAVQTVTKSQVFGFQDETVAGTVVSTLFRHARTWTQVAQISEHGDAWNEYGRLRPARQTIV